MNPEFDAYLALVILAVAMGGFAYAGLYPEKIPFLVKYYEENDN